MKHSFILFTVILIFSCSAPPPAPSNYVRVDGEKIVDSEGSEVLLRTVGLGNWMLPEGYMWKFGKDGDRPRKIEKLIVQMIGEEGAKEFWHQFRETYITENDIARIKELGFNGVRPAMNWRLFMDEESGKFKKEGFRLIDNLVKWCEIHNVYIILDMHGAPGGQTGSNIDDSPNDFPELFSNDENKTRFIRLWVELAKRYKNKTIIIAYGLINEPLPKEFAQFNEQLEPLYQRTVEAIRKVDPHHIISLEGAHWSTDFTIFGDPFDDNLIYQFHKYWSTPDTKSIQQYIDFREKYNVPLYHGESGENSLSWYWAAYQLYEDNNIGWLFWPWKKMDTKNTPYSIKKPDGWDKIAGFSRGGEKPQAAEAQIILDEFLKNIKLENCDYYPDVVNAIFRRIPARIEAENYSHRGQNISYSIQNPKRYAKHYRKNELVSIVKTSNENDTKDDGFAVELQEGDWLHYELNSTKDQILKVLVKVKPVTNDAKLYFILDEKKIAINTNFRGKNFVFGNSEPATIKKGQYNLKLIMEDGTAVIDWFQWN